MTLMFTKVKLAKMLAGVTPRLALAASNRPRRTSIKPSQEPGRRGNSHDHLNLSNRPVRTRMPGGVGGVRSAMIGPYPDCACAESAVWRLNQRG